MRMVMMTLRCPHVPTLDEIRATYGLSENEIDQEYGVIEIDPTEHLYSFMVEEQKASQISQRDWSLHGPYANPRIAPFGPVES